MIMNSFITFFENLREEFDQVGAYKELKYPKSKIDWGEGYGVYTLWKQEIKTENLLYVGLTGKYARDPRGEIKLNNGSFKQRAGRWTPYRFCDSRKDPADYKYTFRYGPKHSNVSRQGKAKYDMDAYATTIPYNEMIIATFDLTNKSDYTPALLEALILTRFLSERGDLPPANNEL